MGQQTTPNKGLQSEQYFFLINNYKETMKSKILNRQSNAVACLKHKLINRHRGPTFSDHSLMVQSNDDVSSKCEKSSWPGDR